MTALWHNDGSGWRLMAPVGFDAEQALHNLIEEAPEMLPLAGSPQLIVVGREVQLGSGYADLLAIETSGRPAVIEVKLAKNAEARRAVVAQVLAYAACLQGLTPDQLERDVLGAKLRERGHQTIAEAVASTDQEGSFDPTEFGRGLAGSLESGSFRLVIVLDDAPPELVRLVGYLEMVTEKLVIDLIAVSAYDVSGSQVLVPRRVEPERYSPERPHESPNRIVSRSVEGSEEFAAKIDASPSEHRADLRRLLNWALSLERQGLVRLYTYQGSTGRTTLLPRFKDEKVGLVTIWNDNGAYISLFRSVFVRRAANSLERVEKLIAPARLGQGNVVRPVSDELLEALTAAYREAASATASKD